MAPFTVPDVEDRSKDIVRQRRPSTAGEELSHYERVLRNSDLRGNSEWMKGLQKSFNFTPGDHALAGTLREAMKWRASTPEGREWLTRPATGPARPEVERWKEGERKVEKGGERGEKLIKDYRNMFHSTLWHPISVVDTREGTNLKTGARQQNRPNTAAGVMRRDYDTVVRQMSLESHLLSRENRARKYPLWEEVEKVRYQPSPNGMYRRRDYLGTACPC